mgnify:CR=1 FL=1
MASSKKPKYPVETPEESKISLTELANNPESRTPIIVCVDCSYSMLQNGRLHKMMEASNAFAGNWRTIRSRRIRLSCALSATAEPRPV